MITFIKDSCIQFAEETVKFNGGELHPRIERKLFGEDIRIYADIRSSDDIMELLLVKDAIDRMSMEIPVHLILPYIPYARQDRVANSGEALSVKVFCNLINNAKFTTVIVHDAHSPVSLALLDNVHEVPQFLLLSAIYTEQLGANQQDIILAPDLGSVKKAEILAKELDLPLLTASKSRNTIDGSLGHFKINYDELVSYEFIKQRIARGGRLIVVDDICDAGGTFIGLAKVLAEQGILQFRPELMRHKGAVLLVTHGIFANNAKTRLKEYYENVLAVTDWTK